jgi:MFS superfamily sulfate permease-like transporter
LFLGRSLINMVPTCVLASILVFVGYKLCRPKVWMHMAKIGREQLVIFAATVLVTVSTDLLLGIAVGVAIELALCWRYNLQGSLDRSGGLVRWFRRLGDLVRNPVGRREYTEGVYDLYLDRPMVCFNLFHLIREMDRIPADAKAVSLQITDNVTVIDHTTCENLFHYLEQYNSGGNGKPRLEIQGFSRMRQTSKDDTSVRLANRRHAEPAVPVG